MRKVKNIGQLITICQNLYDDGELEWKAYCRIRNGLIDLSESLK